MSKIRFAALMLFQFRTVRDSISNKKRVCEERIIIFKANDPETAYKMALKRGKKEETSYEDNDAEIFFEFVGIMELIELGVSLEKDEVWSRMFEKLEPMENKDKFIPEKSELAVFDSKRTLRRRGRLLVPKR